MLVVRHRVFEQNSVKMFSVIALKVSNCLIYDYNLLNNVDLIYILQ